MKSSGPASEDPPPEKTSKTLANKLFGFKGGKKTQSKMVGGNGQREEEKLLCLDFPHKAEQQRAAAAEEMDSELILD